MNSDLPTSLVGGRVRPCCLFTDPFSSPVASFGEVSETDSEVKLFHIRKYGKFSLLEVFHFLEGSSNPGTELGVPSNGDLERSLIEDTRVWVLPGGWRK
ncbi:hypothetical protein F2Q69_00053329 [Brassica cretica]|uniref:Uncharacterized protein n=1 Tax=Brassica cretica TaxID=69181 RepID=A0A8S9N018_BRACR|nr:hypothetical protein F2Q69_00053329 [Brassica cretica]